MISVIDLRRSSPNNSFECSPCGKDKCLYAVFSSGVMLSLRNLSKSWLNFLNIMAESAHFFKKLSLTPKAPVDQLILYLCTKNLTKNIIFWFLRIRFCSSFILRFSRYSVSADDSSTCETVESFRSGLGGFSSYGEITPWDVTVRLDWDRLYILWGLVGHQPSKFLYM